MILIPNAANAIAYQVLLPFLFIKMVNNVIKPSNAVIEIVNPELYVFETSMLIPSPHNIAVEVNAMIQNGHLGSITKSKNGIIPNLLLGLETPTVQVLQLVFIMAKQINKQRKFQFVCLTIYKKLFNKARKCL